MARATADQSAELPDFPISSWPPVVCSEQELTRGEGKNFGASGDRYTFSYIASAGRFIKQYYITRPIYELVDDISVTRKKMIASKQL